jgi:hypothetical protein
VPIVRCPIHKIPYNDENPRGCPACAREREGGAAESDVMRELARVARVARGLEEPPAPKGAPVVEIFQALREPVAPPPAPPTALDRLLRIVRARRFVAFGTASIAVLLIVLVLVSGPRYVEAPDPPEAVGDLRPLPLETGTPITTAFAILGTQPPRAAPDAPQLARYDYGTALAVDALNDVIYAITFSLPNRSWRGLVIGEPEQTVRGALALLGVPREMAQGPDPGLTTVAGYRVYPSLEQRPRRTLRVDVRPPNGCFDVDVDLRPRITGLLLRGATRYAVVGRGEVEPEWVAARVRVVNRSVAGPYAQGIACR